MLGLSIENINCHSPYNIELSEEGAFYFVTDEGLSYEVGFVEDYMIAVDNAYQLFIMPKSSAKLRRDEKMQQTITAIIEEFFRSKDVLLDYICETKDGRQAARNRLFIQWFNNYPQRHLYTLKTISLKFDGISYFASAIIRKDNTHYAECITAIDNFEQNMKDKLK